MAIDERAFQLMEDFAGEAWLETYPDGTTRGYGWSGGRVSAGDWKGNSGAVAVFQSEYDARAWLENCRAALVGLGGWVDAVYTLGDDHVDAVYIAAISAMDIDCRE